MVLNLTTIGMVQSLFSHEKKEGKPLTFFEKKEVIQKVCGKSTREAQRIVFSLSSSPIKFNEKIKMVSVDRYELTTTVDEETVLLLEKLKGLMAHTHPGISNGQLIKILSQIGLEKIKLKVLKPEGVAEVKVSEKIMQCEKNERFKEDKDIQEIKAAIHVDKQFSEQKSVETGVPKREQKKTVRLVAAPQPFSKAEIRRAIWRRDEHQCTNCKSTFALQEDHQWPKAKGGEYNLSNMRLLCRACNQRAAIRHFGAIKMEKFLVSTDS